MKLAELARVSSEVAAAPGRTRKTELLAALLAALAPDEVPIAIAYLTGELPQGRIGIGWAMLRDLDPGAPAVEATLELREVDARFASIASSSGAGSSARRRDALGALYAGATESERDFLGRLLSGGLRQGALEGVMLDAIARASSLPSQGVRRAAMLAGSLRAVGVAAIVERDLSRFAITLFRPISPMLASPADDVASVLERLGRASFELKLDGARVQVHKGDDEVRVYSRSLHDVTARVPELVERVRALPARSLILDGEAIALRQDGAPEPFQVTMRRFGRRLDVERMREELPLSGLYFDCILRDDRSLLEDPGHARVAALAEIVPEISRVPSLVTSDPDEAERFFADALARGHEGVMAKALDAPYEAGSRGASWLKLKLAHTLDLVVLAVERGSGRRSGWLSNLHLGARDPATGGHVMLGKTFKGMTDAMLAWQTEHLRALAIDDDGYVVRVRPELVVEIAFADVQTSPHYPAGLALRFARVARYRTDKRASDADTIDTVRAIHERGRRAP